LIGTQKHAESRTIPFLLALAATGILLPLTPLATNPLHPDEALYGYWASLIASGQDAMLNTVPVDKPPLFIYTLALLFWFFGPSATAARLPALAAHLAAILLMYQLGRTLYHPRTGLLAALVMALSPFSILFAATALTDPLLVAFVLAASLAAARKKAVWAGVWLGFAAAVKQQGVFFVPLALGLLLLPSPAEGGRRRLRRAGVCLLIFAAMLIPPLLWDAARAWRPGFWLQSSLSYGPVSIGPAQLPDRLRGFLRLLAYVTASDALNRLLAVGVPVLLLAGWLFPARLPRRVADWLLAGFGGAFVFLHALVTFQIWDRYMLGIVPLIALLLARILHLPEAFFRGSDRLAVWGKWSVTLLAAALVAGLMATPAQRATRSEYPIGGDHGAFSGAAEVATYLRGHAAANVTLYHRWLGTHWRFYLFRFPYDFRFWQSAEDLARQAAANADGVQYIAFPAWKSDTPARLALAERGLRLQPVFQTFRADGAPAIFLYRIVPL